MNSAVKAIIIVLVVLLVLFIAAIVLSARMNATRKSLNYSDKLLWKDRKHTFLGLPWSFTIYSMDEERLFLNTGIITQVENEVRLYRVLDVQFRQSIFEKILGLGSITLKTSDKSLGNFTITRVCHAKDVKELISKTVEQQRKLNRVSSREFMEYDETDDINDDDNE